MTTTQPVTASRNPFRESYRQRLRALGGKYAPSDVTTDRHIMLLKSMIDFERARAEAIRDTTLANPF